MTAIPDTLRFLLERQSNSNLGAPAPDAAALDLMIRAALRAPDHKNLRPYRFIVAAGDGLDRLGALMQKAAIAAGKPESVVEAAPSLPKRAPMVVIVVASTREADGVPLLEQHLSAGCAVMAMQMAARAMGFGGIWRSGWFMFDRGLHRDLGLGEADQIVGFLYLGTPRATATAPAEDVDTARFVAAL